MRIRSACLKLHTCVFLVVAIAACKSETNNDTDVPDDDDGSDGDESDGKGGSGGSGTKNKGGMGGGGKGGSDPAGGKGGGGSGGAPMGGLGGNTGGRGGGNAGTGGATGGIGGPSSCVPGKYVFCDGFEDDTYTDDWNLVTMGTGTLAVEKGQQARGASALHVKIPARNGTWEERVHLEHKRLYPALKGHYFARFFIKLPKSVPVSPHSWFFRDDWSELGMQNEAWRLFVWNEDGETADSPESTFNKERWACLEMEVDAKNDVMRLWVDNGDAFQLKPKNMGDLTDVESKKSFGFSVCCAEKWEATEVWLDELVLHTSRIGCQ